MNAKQLRSGPQAIKRTISLREWWLTLGLLLVSALVLVFAGRGAAGQPASPALDPSGAAAPSTINNHLYVPCSVSGCAAAPAVINNHLYVPCSVSGCPTAAPSAINNHLYVPCSVNGCPTAPVVINNHVYVPCSVGPCNRKH